MKRWIRSTALAVVTFGMTGTVVLPAQAVTTTDTTFVGRATAVGGIGYLTTLTTRVGPAISCSPLPNGNIAAKCHRTAGSIRSFYMQSDVCIDAAGHIVKPGKGPAHAGACRFDASGTISGHCELNGGQVSGYYQESSGQGYTFQLHFNGVGGELVLTGHVTKQSTGRSGKITGGITAITVNIQNQWCTIKNQWDFTLVGQITITIPNGI